MKLVYDIAGLPKGLDIANFSKIFEQHHMIFWDSSKGGTKPKLYSDKDENPELTIVYIAGKEMDIEYWSTKFKDEEFWEKELHKCKQSPIYFFQNYVTATYPARQADITAYIKDMGLDELIGKDSTEAAKLWEVQKEKVRAAGESITVAYLQERKGIIDVLKSDYYDKVIRLEEKLKDKVRLFDSNGKPIDTKNRIVKLIEKIRTHPIPSEYGSYRTKKQTWDSGMLYVTPYEKLLEIFDLCLERVEAPLAINK